jgi:hypothetical protein
MSRPGRAALGFAALGVAALGFAGDGPVTLLMLVMSAATLAAMVVLIASIVSTSRGPAAQPVLRRVATLREKSWRVAFLRQRDPDSAGHARPRAPSAASAAASC